ncbi:MAG TPA: 4Fe-4S dicluster domain-containing protein [Methanosarcinaceae archaeon]|nr:4Fe-4S dicluster domain-containing protein [Methanosarcinaceae archaeon]
MADPLSEYDTPACETLAQTVKKSLRTSDSIGISRCLQCGACTSSCPAARFTDYNPRMIIKRVMENDISVIEDESIWNCFYCYTCHLRCPRNNSPTQVVQVLKQMAINKGIGLDRLKVLFGYGDTFAEFGVSKIPDLYVGRMKDDFDIRWHEFKEDLDSVRSELGLGTVNVKDSGRGEIRAILEGIGFFKRQEKLKQMARTKKPIFESDTSNESGEITDEAN